MFSKVPADIVCAAVACTSTRSGRCLGNGNENRCDYRSRLTGDARLTSLDDRYRRNLAFGVHIGEGLQSAHNRPLARRTRTAAVAVSADLRTRYHALDFTLDHMTMPVVMSH